MQGVCSSFLCFCLHFYVFFFSFFPLALSSKWSPEDDQQLLEVVRIVGLGNWPRGRKGKHICLHILNFFFFFFNGVLFFNHLFTSFNGSLLESTHTPYKCFLKFPAGVRWGGGLMH